MITAATSPRCRSSSSPSAARSPLANGNAVPARARGTPIGSMPGKQVRIEARLFRQIGSQIPIVPAVISAEEHLVATGDSPRDPHGHRTGFAAALRITDHLRARNRATQFFGQFDFQFMVDRVDRAGRDLLADGLVHHGIGVSQQDRPDAADPVDVLEAIDIPEPRSLGARRVDRRHAIGHATRPAADQLRGSRDQLRAPARREPSTAGHAWHSWARSYGSP